MNVLPLALPHIPLPIQSSRAFLPLMRTLICFSFLRQDEFCCASCELKRHKLRCRRRLAGGGSPSFTAQGCLLQLFHLLEEAKRVECGSGTLLVIRSKALELIWAILDSGLMPCRNENHVL